ncbi:MAG: hypothetical protein JWP06_40 [Candidatus Saccharibacteria bacterium]|nr:hypothetical protein [Candidatus Saccharibacteria bacterium]
MSSNRPLPHVHRNETIGAPIFDRSNAWRHRYLQRTVLHSCDRRADRVSVLGTKKLAHQKKVNHVRFPVGGLANEAGRRPGRLTGLQVCSFPVALQDFRKLDSAALGRCGCRELMRTRIPVRQDAYGLPTGGIGGDIALVGIPHGQADMVSVAYLLHGTARDAEVAARQAHVRPHVGAAIDHDYVKAGFVSVRGSIESRLVCEAIRERLFRSRRHRKRGERSERRVRLRHGPTYRYEHESE